MQPIVPAGRGVARFSIAFREHGKQHQFRDFVRRRPVVGDVRSPQATAAAIATRLPSNPIIRPKMLPGRDGANINGPSLIATPEWLPGHLGKYYLYFAHHEGTYIRLAYADEEPTGPWTVHRAGTLRLAQVPMCHSHIASPAMFMSTIGRRRYGCIFTAPFPAARSEASWRRRRMASISRSRGEAWQRPIFAPCTGTISGSAWTRPPRFAGRPTG